MRSFNVNFYVIAATVIPVLYLALTLQGTMFERLMTHWLSTKDSPERFWPQIQVIVIAFISIFVGAVTLYGVYAEFLAIRALYQESGNAQNEHTVYQSVVLLLIVAAAGPAARFVTVYFGSLGVIDWAKKRRKVPSEDSGLSTSTKDKD